MTDKDYCVDHRLETLRQHREDSWVLKWLRCLRTAAAMSLLLLSTRTLCSGDQMRLPALKLHHRVC